MKTSLLLSAALLLLPLATTLAATNADTATLTAQLEARKQRVKLIDDELKAADHRIEERVDLIIAKLSGIVDSKESRSQVALIKKKTMTALRESIENYQRKRATILEEIRQPKMNLTLEQKQRIAAAFDERTEKRIGQLLTLQQSFPGYRDTNKVNGPLSAQSNEWTQNKRFTLESDALRKQGTEALRASIENIERQNRTLRAKAATVPAAQLAPLNAEIARNDTLLTTRRKQLADLYSDSTASGRPVSSNEAADINRTLANVDADLRTEINSLFSRYYELLPALAEMNTTQATLDAAKKQQ